MRQHDRRCVARAGAQVAANHDAVGRALGRQHEQRIAQRRHAGDLVVVGRDLAPRRVAERDGAVARHHHARIGTRAAAQADHPVAQRARDDQRELLRRERRAALHRVAQHQRAAGVTHRGRRDLHVLHRIRRRLVRHARIGDLLVGQPVHRELAPDRAQRLAHRLAGGDVEETRLAGLGAARRNLHGHGAAIGRHRVVADRGDLRAARGGIEQDALDAAPAHHELGHAVGGVEPAIEQHVAGRLHIGVADAGPGGLLQRRGEGRAFRQCAELRGRVVAGGLDPGGQVGGSCVLFHPAVRIAQGDAVARLAEGLLPRLAGGGRVRERSGVGRDCQQCQREACRLHGSPLVAGADFKSAPRGTTSGATGVP